MTRRQGVATLAAAICFTVAGATAAVDLVVTAGQRTCPTPTHESTP